MHVAPRALLLRCCLKHASVPSCVFSVSHRQLLVPCHIVWYLCLLMSDRFLCFRVHLPIHFSFFLPGASKRIPGRELRKHILLLLSFKDQVVDLPGQQAFSPKAAKEPHSLANTEKLKAQLLQIQTELNNSKQEYEEYKELTR